MLATGFQTQEVFLSTSAAIIEVQSFEVERVERNSGRF